MDAAGAVRASKELNGHGLKIAAGNSSSGLEPGARRPEPIFAPSVCKTTRTPSTLLVFAGSHVLWAYVHFAQQLPALNYTISEYFRRDASLPSLFISRFVAHFRLMCRQLAVQFPEATLVVRTAHLFPQPKPLRSWQRDWYFTPSLHRYFHDINEALRLVGRLEGWPIVDIERLVSMRPSNSYLDVDSGHLNFFVGFEVLKVVMEIAASSARRRPRAQGAQVAAAPLRDG
jgi:hypothetical protein